jgi:hypothetical protein
MSSINGADRAHGPPGNHSQQWTSAVVERVIHVRFSRGTGVQADPHRIVDAWFSLDGELIAEHDPEARR